MAGRNFLCGSPKPCPCIRFFEVIAMAGLWLASVMFLLGLVLTVKGGDLFVDAACWMAAAQAKLTTVFPTAGRKTSSLCSSARAGHL